MFENSTVMSNVRLHDKSFRPFIENDAIEKAIDQVAEKIMVSRVTVSHWENGKSLPDIVSLISLSDLYSISLDELVKGDSKMVEKVRKDAKDANNNKRLIKVTAVLVIAVLLVYAVSTIVFPFFVNLTVSRGEKYVVFKCKLDVISCVVKAFCMAVFIF